MFDEPEGVGYSLGMGKMGRPKKAKADRKSELIQIRVSADERKEIDAAAIAGGVSRSDWIRSLLLSATKRITISHESK